MSKSVTPKRVGWALHELAAALGVSVGLVRKEIRAGRLLAKKFGRRTIVLDEDARFYFANRPSASAGVQAEQPRAHRQ